jgi:hypothetical protein
LATKEESNPYAQAFTLILDELLAVQNLEATSITFLGQGIHGSVFQIGQYVLKVGDLPEILPVPAHPNVLKPIFSASVFKLFSVNFTDEINADRITFFTGPFFYLVFKIRWFGLILIVVILFIYQI